MIQKLNENTLNLIIKNTIKSLLGEAKLNEKYDWDESGKCIRIRYDGPDGDEIYDFPAGNINPKTGKFLDIIAAGKAGLIKDPQEMEEYKAALRQSSNPLPKPVNTSISSKLPKMSKEEYNKFYPDDYAKAMHSMYIDYFKLSKKEKNGGLSDREGLTLADLQHSLSKDGWFYKEKQIRKQRMSSAQQLNEAWGFVNGDTTGEFNAADNDDEESLTPDSEEVISWLHNTYKGELKDINKFIEGYATQMPKIQAWMNKKGIEPERREKIAKKLLRDKGIFVPPVCLHPFDNLTLTKPMFNGRDLCISILRYTDGASLDEAFKRGQYLIQHPEEIKEFIQSHLQPFIDKGNEQIAKKNQSSRNSIAYVKNVVPELFDGTLESLSYRDLYGKLRTLNHWQWSDDKYAKQARRKISNVMHEMEKGIQTINLGTANGWKKGDENNIKYEELHQLRKAGKVVSFSFSKGRCWDGEKCVVLNDDNMPEVIYTYDMDSSD